MPHSTPRIRIQLAMYSRLVAAGALALGAAASAADWPQFRGPNHDATTTETVAKQWPASGPKVVWREPVGRGMGSFAVAGKDAYLFVANDTTRQEALVKLNADTGKPVWTAEVGKTSDDREDMGAPVPRSTPAIDGDKVYVFGSLLKLVCVNAADGKPVWSHDLMSEFAGRNIRWDNATSPVVDGDKVFVAGGGAGQSLLAFNKTSGSLAWKGEDETLTHATPTVATIHGVRQVIYFVKSGLVSVKADDGKVLWRQPFRFNVSTASTPIVGGKNGDIVYCSAGYTVGGGAFRVTKQGDQFTATELPWLAEDKKRATNHWTTPVHKDGYLYGIFGFKEWGTAPLKCIDIETGKEMWSKPGFGSGGGTALAGDALVVQADTGRIAVVEASPKAYNELAAVQALNPQAPYGTTVRERCWTMAVVANGRIYARSTSEAVCLDVSGK